MEKIFLILTITFGAMTGGYPKEFPVKNIWIYYPDEIYNIGMNGHIALQLHKNSENKNLVQRH
ncbi:MAG: hypothetical protein ACQEQ0_09040 [Bacteroidota bacterium]